MQGWQPASAPADRAGSCTDRARSDNNAARIAGCRLAGSCKKIAVKLPVRRVPGESFSSAGAQCINSFRLAINSLRGISRAPSEARWGVFIWQSIMPNCQRSKLPGEMRQRDLRSVADVTEHRFAVEHPPDADTVQTTHQFAIHPGFHGMCISQLMQCAIRRNHVFAYPGAGLRLHAEPRSRASPVQKQYRCALHGRCCATFWQTSAIS